VSVGKCFSVSFCVLLLLLSSVDSSGQTADDCLSKQSSDINQPGGSSTLLSIFFYFFFTILFPSYMKAFFLSVVGVLGCAAFSLPLFFFTKLQVIFKDASYCFEVIL
jgi:hypothetical protein